MPAKRFLTSLTGFTLSASLLIAWAFVPTIFGVPKYIFPSLIEVYRDVVANWAAYQANLFVTLMEASLGLALACIIGSFISVIMAVSKMTYRQVLPILIVSNAIPVVALAPLLSMWLGFGAASKIAVSAFLCFFPFTLTFIEGLKQRHQTFSELFNLYDAKSSEFLVYFMIPNSVKFFIAGLKVTSSIAVIGAIVAEFVGSDRGLGFGILQASYNLNTPRLFGYVIVACVSSYVFFLFPFGVQKVFTYWGLIDKDFSESR